MGRPRSSMQVERTDGGLNGRVRRRLTGASNLGHPSAMSGDVQESQGVFSVPNGDSADRVQRKEFVPTSVIRTARAKLVEQIGKEEQLLDVIGAPIDLEGHKMPVNDVSKVPNPGATNNRRSKSHVRPASAPRLRRASSVRAQSATADSVRPVSAVRDRFRVVHRAPYSTVPNATIPRLTMSADQRNFALRVQQKLYQTKGGFSRPSFILFDVDRDGILNEGDFVSGVRKLGFRDDVARIQELHKTIAQQEGNEHGIEFEKFVKYFLPTSAANNIFHRARPTSASSKRTALRVKQSTTTVPLAQSARPGGSENTSPRAKRRHQHVNEERSTDPQREALTAFLQEKLNMMHNSSARAFRDLDRQQKGFVCPSDLQVWLRKLAVEVPPPAIDQIFHENAPSAEAEPSTPRLDYNQFCQVLMPANRTAEFNPFEPLGGAPVPLIASDIAKARKIIKSRGMSRQQRPGSAPCRRPNSREGSTAVELEYRRRFEESSQRMHRALKAMDKDRDGMISVLEATQALQQAEIGVPTELISDFVERLDQHGDGRVELDNVNRHLKELLDGVGPNIGPISIQSRTGLSHYFGDHHLRHHTHGELHEKRQPVLELGEDEPSRRTKHGKLPRRSDRSHVPSVEEDNPISNAQVDVSVVSCDGNIVTNNEDTSTSTFTSSVRHRKRPMSAPIGGRVGGGSNGRHAGGTLDPLLRAVSAEIRAKVATKQAGVSHAFRSACRSAPMRGSNISSGELVKWLQTTGTKASSRILGNLAAALERQPGSGIDLAAFADAFGEQPAPEFDSVLTGHGERAAKAIEAAAMISWMPTDQGPVKNRNDPHGRTGAVAAVMSLDKNAPGFCNESSRLCTVNLAFQEGAAGRRFDGGNLMDHVSSRDVQQSRRRARFERVRANSDRIDAVAAAANQKALDMEVLKIKRCDPHAPGKTAALPRGQWSDYEYR